MVKKKTTLTRKQVLDYLRDRPEFFNTKDQPTIKLVQDLELTHDDVPNTISLSEYQNLMWRDKCDKAEKLYKLTMDDVRYNQKLMKKMNQAALSFIPLNNLLSVCQTIHKVIREDLKVPIYKLVFFTKLSKSKYYTQWNKSSLPKELVELLETKKFAIGSLSPVVQALFFSEEEEKMTSYLLVPLYTELRVFGAICLASPDTERFSRDLLTDYVEFLFEVIRVKLALQLSRRKAEI